MEEKRTSRDGLILFVVRHAEGSLGVRLQQLRFQNRDVPSFERPEPVGRGPHVCCLKWGTIHSPEKVVWKSVGPVAIKLEDTLHVVDPRDWERWLEANHPSTSGIWLRLANAKSGKKRVPYSDLLDLALCFGWIDALRRSDGPEYYLQRFTPRKPRSIWSKINRDRALALIAAGKMRPAGLREVERAKENGRWENAYGGRKTMEVPADFAAALAANARARATFAKLDSRNRFAFLFRLQSSLKPETRAKKLKQYITMLNHGELIYPRSPLGRRKE